MTANVFGIARCTVGQVIKEICTIITSNLGPKMIKFPTEKDKVLKATSEFLNRFGFPQVIGCVEGTDIPIKAPEENAHDYYSYKMFYSINCQAICDAFGYSSKKFSLYPKELLPNRESVPQLLLGDPA